MVCPYDGSDTRVTNSRPRKKYPEVWRRRECQRCGNIWTTREYIDLSTTHRVLDRHKRLQAFSRDRLYLSVKTALQHRETALEDATQITNTIVQELLHNSSAQLSREVMVATTYATLRRFDMTAAEVYSATHD